jgi:hypothetical protein
MNSNDFISAEKIIAEVAQTVDDKDFKKGFSPGWFNSRVKDALQELAFETYYFKILRDFEVPKNLQIEMPEDTFNIREIYLYTGEICNPLKTQVVYHKRLFNNMHKGDGYSARVKDDGSNGGDVFQPNQRLYNINNQGFYGPKYYYNVHDGVMMFSKECSAFPYVRVIFNGMGGEDGSLPVIPRFFQRAIVDFVEERYLNAMKMREPRKYNSLWQAAQMRLSSYTGSWAKAKQRVSSMDSAEKESMEEYISSMYHK